MHRHTLAGLQRIIIAAAVFASLLLLWNARCSCGHGGSAAAYVTHDQRTARRADPSRAVFDAQRGAAGSGVGTTAAAAPTPFAAAAVDMSVAHLLLPLTNLSALTTAALLDAAGANHSREGRALVRLQQDLYCRWVGAHRCCNERTRTKRSMHGTCTRIPCTALGSGTSGLPGMPCA